MTAMLEAMHRSRTIPATMPDHRQKRFKDTMSHLLAENGHKK